jgi:hypothetical protein
MKSQAYKTLDGWEVWLVDLAIRLTYRGVLEGTPMSVSKVILESLKSGKTSRQRPDLPILLIPPVNLPLPDYRWEAELDSGQGIHTNDPDFNSHLQVIWFTDDLDRNIDELLGQIVSQIVWKDHAKDYDWLP